ncbi:hypothetical protein SteCoe_18067 [Stentor coeruleus]|uniref:Uncharacterized protein n=1 Tax=Stentor coeruleus TaxID=5963 RepID=A0A1R2BXM0_9CILI|nr:hypothetical protein SteCoe_18067 [Stentor coeruleus]
MIPKKNVKLLDRLRNRKFEKSSVTPKSASTILRSYLSPLLSRDYIKSKHDPFIHTSPRFRKSINNDKISSKLQAELDSAYSTLSFLNSQLQDTINDKELICKKIQDLKESHIKAITIRKSLAFTLKAKQTSYTRQDNTENYEKANLTEQNQDLRTLVESEHAVNHIRFLYIYYL